MKKGVTVRNMFNTNCYSAIATNLPYSAAVMLQTSQQNLQKTIWYKFSQINWNEMERNRRVNWGKKTDNIYSAEKIKM